MPTYTTASPYYDTPYRQFYLDVMTNRPIPKEQDDQILRITDVYQYRPDMLAYDLYNDSNLWWVFYQRNPNTLTAPPWDFESGKTIYLPKITTLRASLGL